MGGNSKKRKNKEPDDDGFAEWGGYMAAKQAKLMEQFHEQANKTEETKSDIFKGIAIFVNGYTKPNAEELKILMAEHGGVFHTYQVSGGTTHIIASNLPNVKINKLGSVPIVKPGWISDSLTLGRLLDYRQYLLYTNRSRTQPHLQFPTISNKSPDSSLQDTIVAQSSSAELSIDSLAMKEVTTLDDNLQASTSKSFNKTADDKSILVNDQIESTAMVKTKNVVANVLKMTKTASDPKFLSEFYSNSRLHLIATLGAEFKQLVNEMRENKEWKFSGLEKLKTNKIGQSPHYDTVIMHIDMDCFFVSVGLRNHPEWRGKPVAVTHSKGGQTSSREGADRQAEIALYTARLGEGAVSRLETIDNNSSLSEIASCSYEARKYGIKNGMFMGTALKLCPELKAIPYDFQGYREVSSTLYQTIAEYTLNIEAVSCDEMYVDITHLLRDHHLTVHEWAKHIRTEIRIKTGCPCSTGFGSNRLQARLATKRAKPDGQYHLLAEDVNEYMYETVLSELPGVGRATLAKLGKLGYETCGDLQSASLVVLRKELGSKAGETIYEQAQGIDKKPLCYEHERKSVSAEINYGIRFKTNEESLQFLESLAVEVHGRLLDTGMKAKCITLKLMVRASEAPTETAKFLGHGVCDSLSRSVTLHTSITDAKIIYKEAKTLYEKLNIPFADLRGVGIQLSRLEKGTVNSVMKLFLDAPKKNIDDVQKSSTASSNISLEWKNLSIKEQTLPATRDVKSIDDNKKIASKGSNRGRPKTSKTSKKKDSHDLSIYFKSIQKDRPVSKMIQNECLIASKGIDLEVLNELPEDIRNEIIKEYQISTTKTLSDDASTSNTTNDSHTLKEKTQNVEKSKGKRASKETLKEKTEQHGGSAGFHSLGYEELKVMLKNWFETESVPLEVDTLMLANYFKQLAIDRKIENLFTVVKFLHR